MAAHRNFRCKLLALTSHRRMSSITSTAKLGWQTDLGPRCRRVDKYAFRRNCLKEPRDVLLPRSRAPRYDWDLFPLACVSADKTHRALGIL